TGNPGADAKTRRAHWSFSRAGARERPQVESFIRRGFERAYGARLTRLMPTLMALRCGAETAAACGLRPAAAEQLFLEAYLDRPVETALSRAAGMQLDRADIVEVGNLVIARAGCARRLIFHLTTHLHAAGPAWVVFTAVPALRNSFRRLGIPLVTLGAADGNRLPAAARAEWGSYYEQAPIVTAVSVTAAFHAVCEAACTR
ncbi:MAG TPA: thermostable hemolysin, partial [Burkholderiales bacterium]|nr:thermostable hemolysin [Burkholderiales bacterium]